MSKWGEFVLKDISFSVEKGEIVGVLGANGVGKTTLLKVLAGLLPPRPREKEPERGVWLNGKPIRECNAEIAFISEAGTYLKDLTPREYGAFLADFYPSFDMAYYEKLLHFFWIRACFQWQIGVISFSGSGKCMFRKYRIMLRASEL